MANRIKVAYEKGCDAIDPDNVDGYSNSENGHGLTEQDSIDFIGFLSQEAQQYNISVGLKNAGAIIPNVLDKVHFAVNEQCVEFSECTVYSKFIDNSKPVFHIEYPKGDSESNDNAVDSSESSSVCSKQGKAAGTTDFSTTIKNMNLDGWVEYCNGALAVTPCASNGGKSSTNGAAPPSAYGSGAPAPAPPASYSSAAPAAPVGYSSVAAPAASPVSYSSVAAEAAPSGYGAAPTEEASPASYGSGDEEAASTSSSAKPRWTHPSAWGVGKAKSYAAAPSTTQKAHVPSPKDEEDESSHEDEEPKASYDDEEDEEDDEEDAEDEDDEEDDDDEEDEDEDEDEDDEDSEY